MPYRRLPTTDKARLRALEAALSIASDRDVGKLAYSKASLLELKDMKTSFENHLRHYEFDLKVESEKSAAYKAAFEKGRLYVSHFIQVLFMNIEREELKEEALAFYGLQDTGGKIPPLNNEQEILEWGKKVIDGEQKRIQHGGSPIYNPSIALVKVNVENFYEAAVFQQNLKRNTLRSYEKMQELRKTTNEFISKLWTEIEENVGNVTPKERRQRAQEYGVVYVFRRNEKKKLRSEGLQVDLLFEFN
ncbi:MAG TPA: hypothetical protein ENN90_10185 [Mariniphaga anaerophila]|uniref:Uncharacterized protein n=1 Tax=Mariniphaga anaerophila TaxID=1484053 RepID=A0A831PM66_9BACT|nr:hypothetical protein [Mariniphaga anaerophila]